MHAPGPVPVTFFSRDFVSSPQGMVAIKSSRWAVGSQVRMRSKAHWFFCLSNIFGVLSSAWVLCVCWHLVWMALPFCFSFTAVCSDHTPLKGNSSGIASLLSWKQLLQHGRIAVLQRLSSSNQVEFAEFADKYALRGSHLCNAMPVVKQIPKIIHVKNILYAGLCFWNQHIVNPRIASECQELDQKCCACSLGSAESALAPLAASDMSKMFYTTRLSASARQSSGLDCAASGLTCPSCSKKPAHALYSCYHQWPRASWCF